MPTIMTAIKVAMLPCSTLDPIRLNATLVFQMRSSRCSNSIGASTSRNVCEICAEQSTERPKLAIKCTTIKLLNVKLEMGIRAMRNKSTKRTDMTVTPLIRTLPVINKTTMKIAMRENVLDRLVSRTITTNISSINISFENEYVSSKPNLYSRPRMSFKYIGPSSYTSTILIGVMNQRQP